MTALEPVRSILFVPGNREDRIDKALQSQIFIESSQKESITRDCSLLPLARRILPWIWALR